MLNPKDLPTTVYVGWDQFRNQSHDRFKSVSSIDDTHRFLEVSENRISNYQDEYIKKSEHIKICRKQFSEDYKCKFQVGEEVYVLHHNQIKKESIKEIRITYGNVTIPTIRYVIDFPPEKWRSEGKIETRIFTGHELFTTKEDLIQALYDNKI